jgi:hypothetical protein
MRLPCIAWVIPFVLVLCSSTLAQDLATISDPESLGFSAGRCRRLLGRCCSDRAQR